MIRVAVVIVAYRSRAHLERLLPVLGDERLVDPVVVVDHGDDGSAALAAHLGAITAEDSDNPGFGAGQNRGVALVDNEYVLLLNPDVWPDLHQVASGVALLDASPDTAMVQGAIVTASEGTAERSSGRLLTPVHLWGRVLRLRGLLEIPLVRSLARRTVFRDHVERTPEQLTEVEWLATTMVLVRRSAFLEVGGFDPGFFMYGEDLDLCRRLRAAGWSLWTAPEVWGVHEGGSSSGAPWSRELVWWQGTLRYGARWWSGWQWWCGFLAGVAEVAVLCLRRPRSAATVMDRLVMQPIVVHRSSRDVQHPLQRHS